jgi:hypothetical protein
MQVMDTLTTLLDESKRLARAKDRADQGPAFYAARMAPTEHFLSTLLLQAESEQRAARATEELEKLQLVRVFGALSMSGHTTAQWGGSCLGAVGRWLGAYDA